MSTKTVAVWDNRDAPERCFNTNRGLTHSSESTREGLAMKATRCAVDGCDREGQLRRGFCHTCYERLRRQVGFAPLPVLSTPERLEAGLVRTLSGCLEWTGATSGGYGEISVNGVPTYTHRLAWEIANGPIPKGMLVRHFVCDNPPCCEPTHLRLGTVVDNSADMVRAGRHRSGDTPRRTHCQRGHPFDEANTVVDRSGRHCRACIKIRKLARMSQ